MWPALRLYNLELQLSRELRKVRRMIIGGVQRSTTELAYEKKTMCSVIAVRPLQ
jgi:hypothetical protein